MPSIQRIYITGFMSAGKTTVTPRVAKRLRYSSIDLDVEISADLGLSIPGIFDVMGEKVFRQAESEMLFETSKKSRIVVSLGGGTLTDPRNLELCRATGFLVYLEGTASFLADRLAGSRQMRPLLMDADGSILEGTRLQEVVQELLRVREPIYKQAHAHISVDDRSADEISARICRAARKWARSS